MYIYSKPTIISVSVEQISQGIRAAACSYGYNPLCPAGWNIDKCDPLSASGAAHGTYPNDIDIKLPV